MSAPWYNGQAPIVELDVAGAAVRVYPAQSSIAARRVLVFSAAKTFGLYEHQVRELRDALTKWLDVDTTKPPIFPMFAEHDRAVLRSHPPAAAARVNAIADQLRDVAGDLEADGIHAAQRIGDITFAELVPIEGRLARILCEVFDLERSLDRSAIGYKPNARLDAAGIQSPTADGEL